VIEHFEKPVFERTPREMCTHADSVLEVLLSVPPPELSDGDLIMGQLAENVRQLVHAVPLEQVEQHRIDHPVELRKWMGHEDGAVLVEYAILIAAIVIAVGIVVLVICL
jgi:hypothetical protein